jgi:hypothetical protein
MREADRRRIEKATADEAVIDAAAFYIRHRAVQEHHAGLERQDLAFGFASILDTLSLHMRELPEGVRSDVVSASQRFTNQVEVEGERRRREQRGSNSPRSVR